MGLDSYLKKMPGLRPPTPYPVFRKTRPREEKPNEVVQYAKDMLQKSMLTGVPQIVSAPTRRSQVFKTFVLLGSLTGFLYQTSAFLVIYFSYPTVVDVQVTTPPFVDVPAITICNRNGIRRKEYCRLKPENCEPVQVPPKFCENYPESCEDGDLIGGNMFPTLKASLEENSVTQEILTVAGHSFFPLVSACHFEGINVSFEFCSNSSFKSFMFQDLQGKMKKCYILNAMWAKSTLKIPVVPTRTALKITIDLEPEEYISLEHTPKGQIAIHSPWNILNPFVEGFPIAPGRKYIIQLKEDIKNLLPWPYQTNCTDYIRKWESRGKNGPLSKEMCIEECILNQTMDNCGCVLTTNMYPHQFKFCGRSSAFPQDSLDSGTRVGSPCLSNDKPYKEPFQISVTDICTEKVNFTHCYVKCSPACHDRTFVYTIKEDYIEEDTRKSEITKRNWNRTAELLLVFKRTQVIVYKYRAKYESIELFSFLGGFVGIWLGVSLIALLDFLESLAAFAVFAAERASPRIRSAISSRSNSVASSSLPPPWTAQQKNRLRVEDAKRRASNPKY